jgi:hypothetical protein
MIPESLKLMLRSWISTSIGFIGLLVLVLPELLALIDDDPSTFPDIQKILGGITALGAGIVVKDGNKSTEDVSSEI